MTAASNQALLGSNSDPGTAPIETAPATQRIADMAFAASNLPRGIPEIAATLATIDLSGPA